LILQAAVEEERGLVAPAVAGALEPVRRVAAPAEDVGEVGAEEEAEEEADAEEEAAVEVAEVEEEAVERKRVCPVVRIVLPASGSHCSQAMCKSFHLSLLLQLCPLRHRRLPLDTLEQVPTHFKPAGSVFQPRLNHNVQPVVAISGKRREDRP
jgi:hypothetical protein